MCYHGAYSVSDVNNIVDVISRYGYVELTFLHACTCNACVENLDSMGPVSSVS